MKSKKDKMLAGELYNAADAQLVAERSRCRLLLKQYNDSRDDQPELRQRLLHGLIGAQGPGLTIELPFSCDYGSNITVGQGVYFNFNCVVLDVAAVTIGDAVLFGPNVQIYTATHPVDWQERARGPEFAKPITIGSNVWIGGSVVLCPGVRIGDRSVIGAGSVVTRDIPSDVFAAGNPCRVIRKLESTGQD